MDIATYQAEEWRYFRVKREAKESEAVQTKERAIAEMRAASTALQYRRDRYSQQGWDQTWRSSSR